MEFVGVEFEEACGGGVALVHNSWFTPRKREVHWPPYKQNSRYISALKKGEDPNSSWCLYEIKRSFFHSGDYATAHKKLQLCQKESDIGTDVEINDLIPAKRKRIAKPLFEDSSDEDSASVNQLVRPPRVLTDEFTAVSYAECADDSENVLVSPTQEIVSNSEPSTREFSGNRVHVTPSRSRVVEEPFVGTQVTPRNRILLNSNCSSRVVVNRTSVAKTTTPTSSNAADEEFNGLSEEKLWRILVEIREQNKQILARMRQQDIPHGSQVALNIPVQLPIHTIEDINLLETHLQEKQQVIDLSEHLSTLGGRDVPTKTNRILKHMLGNDVASKFSFFGSRTEKRAFADLKLKAAIVEAVKRDTPGSTDKQVEDAIKVWLKHAPKRTLLVSFE